MGSDVSELLNVDSHTHLLGAVTVEVEDILPGRTFGCWIKPCRIEISKGLDSVENYPQIGPFQIS